jgi:hypothetical protein
MDRSENEVTASGLRVLRFPAFAVRDQPEVVAAQIAAALRLGGLLQRRASVTDPAESGAETAGTQGIQRFRHDRMRKD